MGAARPGSFGLAQNARCRRTPMNGDTKIPASMNGGAKPRGSIGPARLAGALRYSLAGFRHAAREEAAFQQELLLALILLPAAVMLPVPVLERLVLVLSMLFVLVVELLNSAIESTVDRISA